MYARQASQRLSAKLHTSPSRPGSSVSGAQDRSSSTGPTCPAADTDAQPTNTPSGSVASGNGESDDPTGLPPDRLRPGNRVRAGGSPGPLPTTRSRAVPPVTAFAATLTPPRLAL